MDLSKLVGKRILFKRREWEESPVEALVIEVAPSGCAKLCYPNGHQSLLSKLDVDCAVLLDALSGLMTRSGI